MAEINSKLHVAKAYGHAMALLEARKKIAEATAQEESAEAELNLMGMSLWDATQGRDHKRYFECEGDPAIRLEFGESTAGLERVTGSNGKCGNFIGHHSWDQDIKGPHLCGPCKDARGRAEADKAGHPSPPPTPKDGEIPF